ncbi:MAG: hypothetical protein PVJ56_03450 [Desulfobacterales bacterium]
MAVITCGLQSTAASAAVVAGSIGGVHFDEILGRQTQIITDFKCSFYRMHQPVRQATDTAQNGPCQKQEFSGVDYHGTGQGTFPA